MAKKVHIATEKPITPVHVFANEMAELLSIIRPWFFWPALTIGAVILRAIWPGNVFVAGFMVMVACIMPVLIWLMEKGTPQYFTHTIFTGFAVAGILSFIDLEGYTKHQHLGLFLLMFGLPLLCLTWSIRGAAHEKQMESNTHLQDFFETAGFSNTALAIHQPNAEPKEKTKKNWSLRRGSDAPAPKAPEPEDDKSEGTKQRRPKQERRVKGVIHLDPGMTHEDLVADIRRVESAWRVPPGSITLAQNLDDASWSDAIISDPRVIRNPIYYPGPSYVGGSVADPISIGMYQDGTECEWVMLHTMVQIMGIVNSGKSLGGGWSAMAELITRNDCVIWAADVTKGYQTLGPLAPALHRIETTPKGTKMMLEDVNKLIKPRTNYLAEHGYGKWQKDCGLKYLVVWLEEIPDIISDIGGAGKELWVKSVKAARSAGISIVWSLQRSDFTQVPTIARGQSTKMCFGVADEKERLFGLSTAQRAAGCAPELWGQRQQGMCYLDAPGVSEDYLAMPLRTWYWGENDSIIKAHATKYPSSDRPYDDLMVKILGTETPKLMEATPTIVEPLDTNDARMMMRSWILSRRGTEISNSEVFEKAKLAGYQRGWGYKVMKEFADEQLVSKSGEARWFVNDEEDE